MLREVILFLETIKAGFMTSATAMQAEENMNNSNPHISNVKETPLSWLIWSLGCMFYFYEFLLQVSPGIMQNELIHAFNISAQGFGLLGGVYFYSYAGMQIPAGILLDKLGPHRLITFATLTCAIATLAFAHTNNFQMALVARFCIGFGSAFAAVGAMKFAANWFPAKRFTLLTGLMVAIGMSGAIGGEKPLAAFIHAYGWRPSFDILGIFGLLLAAAIHFIAQDCPTKHYEKKPGLSLRKSLFETRDNLKQVLINKQVWLVSTYGGLVFMATPVFCGLWGVPFLEAKYHVPSETAATLCSIIFIGWIIGSPSWGLISDKLGRRKPPMIIGSIVAFICLCTVLYSPLSNLNVIAGLMFLFGLFSAGFLPAFTIIKEISCQKNCATALSFMNMMNMIGIAVAQPLIGVLLDKLWLKDNPLNSTILERTYTASQYINAISLLPIGMFIAILLLPFIKETYCALPQETNPEKMS